MSGLLGCLLGGSALNAGDHLVGFGIPKAYGYVVLVAVASLFLLLWLGIQVGKARKLYKVTYPTMYSADNDTFNCYQRAHQNTLEYFPTFIVLLLLGGLEMPCFSAIAGLIWIAGRVSYAKGYYTGDPKKRLQGSYAYIGLLMLLGAAIKLGVRLALLS